MYLYYYKMPERIQSHIHMQVKDFGDLFCILTFTLEKKDSKKNVIKVVHYFAYAKRLFTTFSSLSYCHCKWNLDMHIQNFRKKVIQIPKLRTGLKRKFRNICRVYLRIVHVKSLHFYSIHNYVVEMLEMRTLNVHPVLLVWSFHWSKSRDFREIQNAPQISDVVYTYFMILQGESV